MTRVELAAATGVQSGVTLTSRSGFTVSAPGTYENLDITGRVTIETTGKVLFRNCRFNGQGDYYAVINIPENFRVAEMRFEFCDLSNAVNLIAGTNIYAYRCDMTRWENGVNFWGPGTVEECYIHNDAGNMPNISGSPHYDGIECNGGGNINVLRCYVSNDADQTSALMFNNYEGGTMHDITVDGCYLAGGGYTVYFDTRFDSAHQSVVNVKVTNNTIKKGYWGHTALYNSGVVITAATGNQLI